MKADLAADVKKAFLSECQVNVLLRHPNVALFMGLYVEETKK